MADLSKQYPRMYQPGVMVGEDIDPRTGQPLSTYHPLMTPGVLVGEDVYPNTGTARGPGVYGDDMPSNPPGMRQTQGVDKRKPESKAQPSKPFSRRSRYSSGKPGGYGSPEYVAPESTGRSSRRGTGLGNRPNQVIDIGRGYSLGGQIGRGTKSSGTTSAAAASSSSTPDPDYNKLMSDIIAENQPETLKTEKPLADDAQLQPETILTQELRNSLAPDGSNSQGTRTSPSPLKMKDVNDLLALQGIRKFTPNQEFNSNQLPTTSGSPYGSISEDAQVMGMSKEDSQLIESGGKVETVFKDGVESSRQIFKDPGSRAFLDYEGPGGSMGAFRAAERARGMITLQGKTYIPNPLAGQDGQEEFQLISQDQRNDVNSGRITAQDLASSYINRINGANADFSAQDYQTMGGNEANVPTMSKAGSVEVDIDADFDYENPTEVRRGMVF